MNLNGAQLLVECLKKQGVDTIFGYPGGTVLNIYDVLYDARGINHIITCHEQGATHAADGYARSTGKVGVVLVTSGPGASNTVTGIATAFRDSIPLVIITGQVARHLIGKDSFQELNIVDITKPITKESYLVDSPESIPFVIENAFKTAKTGRPGPVLIDIPKDIQQAKVDFSSIKESEKHIEDSCDKNEELKKQIFTAIKFINESEKPVIFAGGGVISSEASKMLKKFAEKINAPVACSLMGLGSFPGDHELFTGMLGMHGSFCSNYAFTHCDLLIALGTRLNDRVICNKTGFAPNARIIHVDIEPSEFGKNIDSHLTLCGDLKNILNEVSEYIQPKKKSLWNEQVENWKKEYDSEINFCGDLSPKHLLTKLKELVKEDAIICTEVGQNQMWTGQYYKFNEPRSFISSGGLGTMGFGLGAAIGSSIGKPDKRVINIAGDGSFKMNMNELATVSKYKLPIIQIVLNNNSLGMVRQWQRLFYNNRLSFTTLTPDVEFTKLAEAFGIKAMVIRRNDEVEEVLSHALSLKEPVLIECLIHPDNLATPMVPLGESIGNCVNKFDD